MKKEIREKYELLIGQSKPQNLVILGDEAKKRINKIREFEEKRERKFYKNLLKGMDRIFRELVH